MKGKNSFSIQEAAEIKKILSKKSQHPRDKQQSVRAYLRKKMHFYISDFTTDKGFNDNWFDYYVEIGDIKIF